MILCPWCGTSFTTFETPCTRCGGPIPAPASAEVATSAPEEVISLPPKPPREIALQKPTHYYTPSWSPDSKKILYHDTNLKVWVLDVETGAAKIVGDDPWMVPARTRKRRGSDSCRSGGSGGCSVGRGCGRAAGAGS